MTATAFPHPIDYAALRKGDVIDGEKLELALRCTSSDPAWRLQALKLMENIRDRCGFLSRFESERRIRILTDAEASDWNQRLYEQGLRGLLRRQDNDQLIARDGMTEAQAAMQDHRAIAKSQVNQALARAARQASRELAAFSGRALKGDESIRAPEER